MFGTVEILFLIGTIIAIAVVAIICNQLYAESQRDLILDNQIDIIENQINQTDLLLSIDAKLTQQRLQETKKFRTFGIEADRNEVVH